jgi:hypothetical protein
MFFNLYISANNLYGWAQSQPLPVGDYQWLTKDQIKSLNIASIPKNGFYGYVFEVDLSYPTHLHASHSSFPLAPHTMKITGDNLSPYAKGIIVFDSCGI